VRHAGFWSGLNLQAIADDVQVSGHYLLAVISNIHLYAGGLAEISPQARLDDGLMDLWLFAGETVFETVQHAWNIFAGRHLQSNQARCIPFQNLRLFSDQSMEIQLDGEPLMGDREVKIQVQPKSLKVMVPADVSRALFSEES
jgi:diacylglycerol kinase family enzyme